MKIFVSTPITGFDDSKIYEEFRDSISRFIGCLDDMFGSENVYAAIKKISNINSYESPMESAIQDLNGIEETDIFLLIYPQKLASSALIELGYAFALQKLIYVFANREDDLPYMLHGIMECFSDKVKKYIGDWDNCCDYFINDLKSNRSQK
ncbi:MAG: hypothetical protein HDR02_14305 [Lachnospiraceae bacterium]|nr:hypothetical protein [Lachnospiraceae bacterium]